MTAFIASVRVKRTGEVFYRIKGQLSMWTSDRSKASHFPTRDEAERSIAHTSSASYDKFVGTAREVGDQIDGVKYIAAVRYKETGTVRYRVAPTYPHVGGGPIWSEDPKDAHRFNHEEAAEHVLRLVSERAYEKKVGTLSEVKLWAKQLDMKKLQDSVNESIKKIADFYQAPALFLPLDGLGGRAASVSNVAPKEDPILALIETYIEKAQKIEEEGADEYTWRGFLHAFLKDIMETRK